MSDVQVSVEKEKRQRRPVSRDTCDLGLGPEGSPTSATPLPVLEPVTINQGRPASRRPVVIPTDWILGFQRAYQPLDAAPSKADVLSTQRLGAALDAVDERGDPLEAA